ncbi:tail fiber domain-containing protein [Acinetobacter sp.]|uniref:tail fiber domain-containing protein n=1 Tax=Acinetobacter sp. TaxID=472 RepID=UPI003D0407DE
MQTIAGIKRLQNLTIEGTITVAGNAVWHAGNFDPSSYALVAHNHDAAYSAIGHNHDITYAVIGHNHNGVYEPIFSKNTGFNLALGSTTGTVAEGNHTHSTYSLTSHNHDAAYAAIAHNHDLTYAALSHSHTGVYEPVFTKNTGFNLVLGTTAGTVSEGNHSHSDYALTGHNHDAAYAASGHNHDLTYAALGHNHTGVYEPVFTKNSAFNKNFGSAADTVCQGNDTRLSDSRTPLAHTLDSHSNITVTSNTAGEILKWNGSAWINNTLSEAGIQPAGSYLTTNQTITLSGDATGSGTTSIVLTLANSGVTAGTYTKITVDAKGRATSGTTLSSTDIPTLTLSKISDAGTAAATNTGIASGNVPVLDGSGKLNTSVLPALAITDTSVVANEAAMLALTAQTGDVAVRSDLNKSYILKAEPASTLSNWQELLTPTDAVLSVAGRTGVVTLTSSDVGLGNVTNESKATMFTSPAFTGTPTSASLKLNTGATVNEFSIDGTMSGNSDSAVPTEKAVKTYVDNNSGVGTHALDFHSDVTITSNTYGEILKWNGSAWVNNTLSEANIPTKTGEGASGLWGITILKSQSDLTAADYVITGGLTGSTNTTGSIGYPGTGGSAMFMWRSPLPTYAAGNWGIWKNHTAGDYNIYVGSQLGANHSDGFGWKKIWNEGNDGAGSGLDADLLDGNHASAFAAASHTHSYLPLSGGTLTGGLKTVNGSSIYFQDLDGTDGLRFHEASNNYGYIDMPNGNLLHIRNHTAANKAIFTNSGLDVYGTITATGEIYAYYSDLRLKNVTGNISGALDKITSLNGINFIWNEKHPNEDMIGKKSIGLIAQDVEKVFPEAVGEKDGYKMVQYEKLVPVLVEAIKELKAEIEDLKRKQKSL